MSRPRKSVPTYRKHKQSGQAIVTLRTSDGGRRDITLGEYDSPESHEHYQRILAELRTDRPIVPAGRAAGAMSVNEVALAFLRHAERHYRHPDGRPTSELLNYKLTLRPMRELYGSVPASAFGPVALRAVRERMIATGWCRKQINKRVGRIKRVFGWAVDEQLIPPAIHQALIPVQALQAGRSGARETAPVKPVALERVNATLPQLTPTVQAMVEVQLLTGMRPGEVCRLCPADLDESGPVWIYKPPLHKNAWRGKPRTVAIGPRAQAVLNRFRPADPAEHFFSPRRTVEQFHAERTEKRSTRLYPSHVASNVAKRKRRPKWKPAEVYRVGAYGLAVDRACDRAFPLPKELAKRKGESRKKWWARLTPAEREQVKAWRKAHRWHPNQLRHSHGTAIRERFGIEAAQVAMGHEQMSTTEIYAEKNLGLAVRVAAEAG